MPRAVATGAGAEKSKRRLAHALIWIPVAGTFLGIIVVVYWMQWNAYFERFPQASWWTFFFK